MGRGPEFEQKRVLAVHDLSCYGTASLGVAVPVLTAFGHEVVAFPSVILSSTTDIDRDPIALETTDWMRKVIDRWNEHRVTFDAIYTGWLANPKQIDLLTELCEVSVHDKTTVFIDPVLGDGGMLYPSHEKLAKEMNRLVVKAQVITPNPTEAALLLKKSPQGYGVKEDGTISAALAEDIVADLATAYPHALPIIKSVTEGDCIGVCVRFTSDNTSRIRKPVTKTILATRTGSVFVGGTGDLFASLVVGKWLKQELGRDSNKDKKLAIVKSSVETISSLMEVVQRGNMRTLPFRNLLAITNNFANSSQKSR